MQYELIYDASTAAYSDWWLPAIGLIPIVWMASTLYEKRRANGGRGRLIFAAFAIPLPILWVLGSSWLVLRPTWEMRKALREGRFTVVEGAVENFGPSDAGDHQAERWQVKSNGVVHEYHYVQSQLTPGFRKTAVHGGPIRPGLRIRIADVDGYIARLEIEAQ